MTGLPRIKLQWGASRATPGEWYLGLVGRYIRRSGRGVGWAVSIRGVLVLLLILAVIGYFSGAAYYWWRLEQRRYNYVRYADVLLYPLSEKKRVEVRELQGQALIASGLDDLDKQIWNRGMMSLRIGLDKYPRDLKARLKLAQLFIAYRIRDKAQETLVRGLDYGWPGRAYLQSAIELATSGEDYELAIEICDRAMALHDPARNPAADRRWLAEQRIRSLLAEKRSDEALAYAEKEVGEIGEATLSELKLLAMLQAGRAAEAVVFAEAWRARAGDDPQVLRLLSRAYREAGRPGDMSRTLDAMRSRNPADPRAHVFSFIQELLAGREAEGRALLEDYIFRFGGTEANYVLAAEPLAEINRAAELDILLAAAAERGMREPRLKAARLQVLISAKRWAEATRQIEDIRSSLSAGAARSSLLDLFQYLVAAASDPADGAQSSLTDYVRMRQLPMPLYRQCIDVLRKSGRVDTARQIVTFAEGVFPRNQYLADSRVALDAELESRRAAEVAARPVSAPVVAFVNPTAFYAELEQAVSARGASAGLAMLRELRQARPSWLAAEDETLSRKELEYRAEGDDLAAFQGAVRRYLTADRARIQTGLALARRLHEANRPSEARMLLTEILRRSPAEPQASELLARWFPASATGKPRPAEPVPAAAP